MKRTASFIAVLMIGTFLIALAPAQAYQHPYDYGYRYPAAPKTAHSGKILLQVQDKGQAWYVNPSDQRRYFLGRPNDAFAVMKSFGVGITNANLRKIAVAPFNYYGLPDTDRDGLYDDFEKVYGTDLNNPDTDYDGHTDLVEVRNGYNPFGAGRANVDMAFARANKGKIFLQVEAGGAAWYINPADLKAYYLGRPADAFNVMRFLGVGASNATVHAIPDGDRYMTYPGYDSYNQAPQPYPYYNSYQPAQPVNRYYIRMFNVDNVATAIVNGKNTYTATYGAEKLIDITTLIRSGDNTIRFKTYNDTTAYSWGYQIKRNDQVLFSESAGSAGVVGANNNDLNRTYQDVYDKTITINDAGVLSITGYQAPAPLASSDRWYIRVFNADDRATAAVNNQTNIATSFDQDSGFREITSLLRTGDNTLDFKTYNEIGAYAYGFQIKKGDTLIFSEVAGDSGVIGVNNNDSSRQYQYVYNKTITISDRGLISVRNNNSF